MSATDEPHARNCFRCPHCHGPVDRYEHAFQCRDCGALGDLMTGIMMQAMDLATATAPATVPEAGAGE